MRIMRFVRKQRSVVRSASAVFSRFFASFPAQESQRHEQETLGRSGTLALVTALPPGEVVGVAAQTDPVTLTQLRFGTGAFAPKAGVAPGEVVRLAAGAEPVARTHRRLGRRRCFDCGRVALLL